MIAARSVRNVLLSFLLTLVCFRRLWFHLAGLANAVKVAPISATIHVVNIFVLIIIMNRHVLLIDDEDCWVLDLSRWVINHDAVNWLTDDLWSYIAGLSLEIHWGRLVHWALLPLIGVHPIHLLQDRLQIVSLVVGLTDIRQAFLFEVALELSRVLRAE